MSQSPKTSATTADVIRDSDPSLAEDKAEDKVSQAPVLSTDNFTKTAIGNIH